MKRILLAALLIALGFVFSAPVMAVTDTDIAAPSAQLESFAIPADLSKDEQKWFRTFQKGTFFVDGWIEITRDLLVSTPVEFRESQKKHLEQLGLKIGLEWCKNNDVRRVDTKMLQQWGQSLKKTAQKNPEQLPEIIVSIDQELNNILN